MKKIVRNALAAAAFVAASVPASMASAAVLTIDITGRQTFDLFQDTSNTVLLFNIGSLSQVTALTYDVTIATIGGSYLSEAAIYYTDALASTGVVTRPGFANANPGTMSYTGTSDLVALDLDFTVGADGILRVEFAETFDDLANAADATFTRGTLSFTYTPVAAPAVPEPASWALLIGGFGLIGGTMRRRQQSVRVTYA